MLHSRVVRVGTVIGALVALILGGCELIASVDRSLIQDPVSAGGMGGSGGGTGLTGGSGGTGGGDCVPSECPGADEDCRVRACDSNDECTFEDLAEGTTCTGTGDEKVCDGNGSCVECNTTTDCDGTDVCDQDLCVPAGCVNGQHDGDETDTDCGGSCSPCENGEDCNVAADCESGVCGSGGSGGGGGGGGGATGVCASCTGDGDCESAHYCDGSQECQPKVADGGNCTAANQCLNGNCPTQDQVCCDTACDATCEACLASKNGGSDGTCAPVTAGPDPDGDCANDVTNCTTGNCTGTAGACEAVQTQAECRATQGACDPAENCDGSNPGCPTDAKSSAVCHPSQGVCDPAESCDGQSNTCPTDAKLSTECNAVAGPCDVAESCDGQANSCPSDGFIADGQPSTGDACAPYLCDGTQSACPSSCSTNADCVSPMACPSGLCCLPLGATCTVNGDCCTNDCHPGQEVCQN
ncbi:MAG: hypothetical protein JRI68_21870 [Deltaproteobacteria bacterium]|nr:hypothetical protein [Deltaproteobacteria bacterium]